MSQTNQRIDGKRLWDSLMSFATIGATPKGGVRRLALSAVDQAGRDRFRAECQALGLSVRVDAIGNMFARREGRDPTRLPVLFGSHLDSQPSGGKFDGALGVLAGLEVMRSLRDLGITTEAPVELVNWTDEEGSRFGHSLMGSGVWAGVYDEDHVRALTDSEGVTVASALDSIGYHGAEPARPFPADAYFELHIEQGPILEREQKQIGIVTGAQAQVWYDAVTIGQDSHAGTTPPSTRKDALVCAARIIDLVDKMMRARGEDGRGTVGQLQVIPNSRNVVPGEVRFSVEFRHPDPAEIDRLDAQFPREAGFIARDCGVELKLTTLFKIPAQPFDPACIDLVRQGAARAGYSTRDIVSGAGHDAVYVARHVPTAMIFTPCKDGLSHNEAESIEPDEAAAGAQVLFEAVVARANRLLPKIPMMLAFNPRDPAFIANPYPVYHQLRAAMPVWRTPDGRTLLTRYEDTSTLVRDRRLGKNFKDPDTLIRRFGPTATEEPAVMELSEMMLMQDPPDHTRLRGLVAKVFTARKMEDMRPGIQAITGRLLDEVEAKGEMDAVRDLAFPLPVLVICEMLGIPEEDRASFVNGTASGGALLNPVTPTRAELDDANRGVIERGAYFEKLFELRRKEPRDDLLTLLVQAEESGDRLTSAELRANVTLLFAAGHETTVNLIGNGIWSLHKNPSQWAALRDDPSLIPNAIEEILRYESPVQMVARNVAEPMEFGGIEFAKGSPIIGLLGAANRDPDVFPDPDRMDVTRERLKPLSFGGGIHHCIGAQLARIEAEVVFSTLLRRLPDMRLPDCDAPKWRESFTLRGLTSLPATWH